MFLNQFEFTRYNKNDLLQNNDKFNDNFFWLYSPMNRMLFEKIGEILKKENPFLKSKARIFDYEVCNLVSLEERNIKMKKKIYYLFGDNMYKYRGFSNAMKFLKKEMSQKIKDSMNLYNITKSMATASCKNPQVKFVFFQKY